MGHSLMPLLYLPKRVNAVATGEKGLGTIPSGALSACYMPPSAAGSFQVLKTTKSCLFQMEVDCFLWDEYSFHLHLPQEQYSQPKRNAEMNEENAVHS